jgi:hypothetical protein
VEMEVVVLRRACSRRSRILHGRRVEKVILRPRASLRFGMRLLMAASQSSCGFLSFCPRTQVPGILRQKSGQTSGQVSAITDRSCVITFSRKGCGKCH